jgi:hypothetical protein
MRYRPVETHQIIAVQYKKAKAGTEAVQRNDGIPSSYRRGGELFAHTGVEQRYFQVRSKLLGDCGHKHKTEQAADPCLRRMKAEWSALRSKQSKRNWKARRAAGVAVTERRKAPQQPYLSGVLGLGAEL